YFLTCLLFFLFVFFAPLLMSRSRLAAFGGRRAQLREALNYVLINKVVSGFSLLGVAGLFHTYGTLNMADLAVRIQTSDSGGWLSVIAVVFLVVFGLKAAMGPPPVGRPDADTGAAAAAGAVFAGVGAAAGGEAAVPT